MQYEKYCYIAFVFFTLNKMLLTNVEYIMILG